MIERIKAVNNPLTIIAIFAALAEIAGTVALRIVADNLQVTFIWFVMLFPALLVLLFFLTLNFNPKVLYAPSDFKNEENFLSVIKGANRLSIELEEVQKQLQTAKVGIISEAVQELGIASEKERARFKEIVSSKLDVVKEAVQNTRDSVEEATANSVLATYTSSSLKKNIVDILVKETRPMPLREIAKKLGYSSRTVERRLRELTDEGYVTKTSTEIGETQYEFSRLGPR